MKNQSLINVFILTQLILLSTISFADNKSEESDKPNILFIAIDDLKPLLGCYGDHFAITPNIDKLATGGTVFLKNYCQQAVCAPTRVSMMTGMRPDYTKVWDLKTQMREKNPDILSLPQYLIKQGYSTQGIGKIFDPRSVDKSLDEPSWSVPYYKNANQYYSKETGNPEAHYQLPETKKRINKVREEGKRNGLKGKELSDFIKSVVKPSVECFDVPDNAYKDGAVALYAKDILVELSKKESPFFFAVGFTKPHLPFVAPKKYWDLYQRNELPLAPFQEKALNSPELAYRNAGELYSYSDIPPIASFTDQKVGLDLPIYKQKELIHGYYAATSYSDAQVGILLNTIDSLGLLKNTIIILWGDHGWHLGDHNLWCKHTNFEQATHTPLLISAPEIKPSVTTSISEFVDIFPTLCDLSGVPIPSHLQGKSLVPIMKEAETKVKEFAVSQYPRSRNKLDDGRLGWSDGKFMGYSIRTEKYRYTIWMKNGYRSGQTFKDELVIASELYDYTNDPNETINIVNDSHYKNISKNMHEKMLQFFESQRIIN